MDVNVLPSINKGSLLYFTLLLLYLTLFLKQHGLLGRVLRKPDSTSARWFLLSPPACDGYFKPW